MNVVIIDPKFLIETDNYTSHDKLFLRSEIRNH